MQKRSQQLCSPEWRSGGTGSSNGLRDGRCGSRVGGCGHAQREEENQYPSRKDELAE